MTNKRISFVAAALLSLAIAFPSLVAAQNYPDSVKQYVANTRKQIKTVGMPAFKAVYDAKLSSAVIVDVRSRREYAAGLRARCSERAERPARVHDLGARRLPRQDRHEQVNVSLLQEPVAAARWQQKSLQDLGFTNVNAVVMLFEDWKKAGYPVEMPKK